MAADVAPGLYDELESVFRKALAGDKKAAAILEKISSGTAKYSDAGYYAEEVGTAMNTAFKSILSSDALPDGKMYWNIAERTIEPLYEESYNLVSQAATDVQQALNAAAGINLKAQTAQYDENVARNIMNELCAADNYDDVAYKLYESADMYTRSVVDDTLKENVDFQGKAGRHPRIIRTAEANCCSWCSDLEGVYEYNGSYSVPENVYKRHNNCRCDVEYDPGTGRVQNVHSKEWKSAEERDKIEERKSVGINGKRTDKTGLAGNIINNYKILNTYSPAELKTELERAGYKVTPFSKGNYKNISFENGGGYKTIFGGDGIIAYHPAERSHHDGAYYKCGDGQAGIEHIYI